MNASVTAGCAMATFVYYNLVGMLAQGLAATWRTSLGRSGGSPR